MQQLPVSLILVACLFPLGIYTLVLGLMNRRQGPLLVHGAWDFAGVLFAASGFLGVGGPFILYALNEHWRMLWLLGNHRALAELGDVSWAVWTGVSVLYFVAVVGGAAALLGRRRHQTAVYNVDPAAFEDALGQALQALELPWNRVGNQVFLRAAVLDIEAFPAMRHVTLRWDGAEPGLRRQVEGELRRALAEVVTPDNPAAGWLLGLSALLFLGMFTVLTVLLMLLFYGRR